MASWLSAAPLGAAAAGSACLFFIVQPLLGKYLVPWYGGSAGVWSACMLFFQLALIAGYLYAHLLLKFTSTRQQVLIHGTMLLAATIALPLTPAPLALESYPAWDILAILTVTAGLPCVVLSATAPLIQGWFAASHRDRSPYPLYALSNAGSLVALVAYPFVIEPWLPRGIQVMAWSVGFQLFAAVMLVCLYLRWQAGRKGETNAPVAHTAGTEDVSGFRWDWLVWSACSVALLLALTERMTTSLVVVPMLWVLPFVVYLLTYILAFAGDRWYPGRIYRWLLLPAVLLLMLMVEGVEWVDARIQIPGFLGALFVICMVCHGELARARPPADNLSAFYLTIAVGGALGGGFVSLAAPLLFDSHFEFHFTILLILLACLSAYSISSLGRLSVQTVHAGILAGLFCVVSVTGYLEFRGPANLVERSRNFYGVVEVYLLDEGRENERLLLLNDGTEHGVQYTSAAKRQLATGYYASDSGAGRLLDAAEGMPGRKIGLVGLGTGTLMTFTGPQDVVRIYEINPEVIRIAESRFTFIRDSGAQVEIVAGDARKTLETEPAQAFDVLVLDAFTGDSIPLHLLTVEAFDIYLRHLKPDGHIAVLTDTWHMNFSRGMTALGMHLNLKTVEVTTLARGNENWGAEWFLFSRLAGSSRNTSSNRKRNGAEIDPGPDLMTDDYTSIWNLVSWDEY